MNNKITNSTVLGDNNAFGDNNQIGNNNVLIQLDDTKKTDYKKALDNLSSEYEKSHSPTDEQRQNVKNIINAAKNDIDSGEITESKKGIFEQIASGFDKGNSISKYINGLFELFTNTAG